MKTFRFLIAVRLLILCLSVLSLSFLSPAEGQVKKTGKKSNFSKTNPRRKAKAKAFANPCAKEIPYGVKGTLLFFKGNMMPSPDRPAPSGIPVVRKVALFQITTLDQVTEGQKGGFYKKIKTKKIKECISNLEGCFAFGIKPGRYSLFVWENGEWYANSVGDKGEIMAVEVKENELTEVEFHINHAAVY